MTILSCTLTYHVQLNFLFGQESIPVGCVPFTFLVPGGSAQTPCRQTPLDAGHVAYDAYWEADLPLNRLTHMCKNITLPQTSFAGGKNVVKCHADR